MQTHRTTPSWKQHLGRSLHINRSKAEAKYFQVASVGSDNLPQVRTMVFRGFCSSTPYNLFAVTDTRSDKIIDFEPASRAQICWYFAKSREQYRLSCKVVIESEQTLIKEYWCRLSENARQSFYWPSPKSPLLATESSSHVIDDSSSVSPNFVLLRFCPNQADYLSLKTNPQTRFIETLQDDLSWAYEAVNP